MDYKYNVRGWLKEINDPLASLGNDLFAFKINYNTAEKTNNTTSLFNGNISETHWKTVNDGVNRSYGYSYDNLNRLTSGLYYKGGDLQDFSNYEGGITYDKNGNILNLARQGNNGLSDGIDRLTYVYDAGNKLLKVTDEEDMTKGFIDGNTEGDDYAYDANGNMIEDKNKGIKKIEYNHLNLPVNVEKDEFNFVKYVYDALGNKLSKNLYFSSTEYAGSYIYEISARSGSRLKYINQPEGYIEPNNESDLSKGFQYVYQYKDHLGNIRLSYADDNTNGSVDVNEIREEKNYYPFGLTHKGYNSTIRGRKHNYGYNGKEENDELGLEWLDFGARNYDASLARFMNLDPKAETFNYQSPFAYAVNNPILFIDENGEGPGLGSPGGALSPGGISIAVNRLGAVFSNLKAGQSLGTAVWNAYKQGAATATDFTPGVGDAKGLVETFTGKDLVSGEKLNLGQRALGLFFLSELRNVGKAADAIQGFSKADNLIKYSDETSDLIEATGKIDGGKEIITTLKSGEDTLENGINVAKDVIGDLGDDAIGKVGKFGSQEGVKVGHQSANGKKGYRVDYDSTKGGHINWWNGKEKGAIILKAGQDQIDQIIKNGTF